MYIHTYIHIYINIYKYIYIVSTYINIYIPHWVLVSYSRTASRPLSYHRASALLLTASLLLIYVQVERRAYAGSIGPLLLLSYSLIFFFSRSRVPRGRSGGKGQAEAVWGGTGHALLKGGWGGGSGRKGGAGGGGGAYSCPLRAPHAASIKHKLEQRGGGLVGVVVVVGAIIVAQSCVCRARNRHFARSLCHLAHCQVSFGTF